MNAQSASDIIAGWPEESREAAQLVIDKYGEPQESTPSYLIWLRPGPWKRMVASKDFVEHHFPIPHIDSVTSVLDYRVPPEKATDLARFDGSVVVGRTEGEVSARCHDEEANNLALNLMHDIVTGAKTVDDARQYYAKEFLDVRRGRPTPYMSELRVPATVAPDPDRRVLSDTQLEEAQQEGKQAS
ncbi:hypothetical protein MF406_01020 [Georgenia sp. TF02-10]|uniref:hypothetical protein n=1 Tax=Georgenia sp. TF02-10 TaxID=2917725 RepID=UPI001FA80517|nr:hypothetical protein [Georgenia sp. TF02-10]UNX54912.1 hypothetical protein MF406_01020 [Georgenia sp. TF02-10]